MWDTKQGRKLIGAIHVLTCKVIMLLKMLTMDEQRKNVLYSNQT